jgi:mannitol-1-/sugar-/sorbitol-6-/2-deoxyglucose-6-phosphatase
MMQLNTVIFDMDGLLIDSEPLWYQAAKEVFLQYGVQFTLQQYSAVIGLRTKEFVELWFRNFNLPENKLPEAEEAIIARVVELIKQKGKPMPGVAHIINFFIDRNFKIGLATSSGMRVVDTVIDLLGVRSYLQAIASAENLALGKPHPQVYLNCAAELQAEPQECLCFEDSFNGMIAAKAARIKCVIVPSALDYQHQRWAAADLKISSLNNFNELLLQGL